MGATDKGACRWEAESGPRSSSRSQLLASAGGTFLSFRGAASLSQGGPVQPMTVGSTSSQSTEAECAGYEQGAANWAAFRNAPRSWGPMCRRQDRHRGSLLTLDSHQFPLFVPLNFVFPFNVFLN